MVRKYFENPLFIAAVLCCVVFYSGLFTLPEQNPLSTLVPANNIRQISGTLLCSPVKAASGTVYYASLSADEARAFDGMTGSATGTVRVLLPCELVEAYFPGKLYSAANRRGAYVYETGGKYVFTGRLYGNGFKVTGCMDMSWDSSVLGKIRRFRALCRLQFKRLMYAWGDAGGLLLALLSGSREYTDGTVSEAFRTAGLSHILALSGMHLSLFSGIAGFLGKRIRRVRLAFLLKISFLAFFVWFAGFSPSLLRAFICSLTMLLAVASGIPEPDMLLVLCFSFLFQAVLSPADVTNAGFILSYGALAGILLTADFFKRGLSFFLPDYVSSSLSASCGAQLFTAPYSVRTFGTFSPIGILATVAVAPLVVVFLYSGLFLIVLGLLFPGLVRPSGIFLDFQYTVIKYLVFLFSRMPVWRF